MSENGIRYYGTPVSEPCHEKTCFMLYRCANNKDAELRSLVSVFVVCCLDSTIHIYLTFQDSSKLLWLSRPD